MISLRKLLWSALFLLASVVLPTQVAYGQTGDGTPPLAQCTIQDRPIRSGDESVCGLQDDTQNVFDFQGNAAFPGAHFRKLARSVGRLAWKQSAIGTVKGVKWFSRATSQHAGWCTGALIGPDLMLTAAHCFKTEPWHKPLERLPHLEVQFGYELTLEDRFFVDPGRVKTTNIVEIVEFGNPDLIDYAIIRLGKLQNGKLPGEQFGMLQIAGPDALQTCDRVAIIQHPSGVPKRIGTGPIDIWNERIRFDDIDTMEGSSGAPILNSAGKIVGVHTNGGCNDQRRFYNFGIRIEEIIAASALLGGNQDEHSQIRD